jgi:hypothetical protein
MPIVTPLNKNNKSIIAGVRIKQPNRSLTEFFGPPNKKQKLEKEAMSTVSEEKEEKKIAPVMTPVPQQRIKELTPEHITWMNFYIDTNKYNGGWIVTEYIDGKEIVIYSDGKTITYGTPYHGFINKDVVPAFEDSSTLEKHVHAVYRKVKEIDPLVDHVALKLIFYGSRMNPSSVYTNTDVRMMLVDVYWRYRLITEYESRLMTYSMLCKLLDTKGAFLDENGKGIERLCFRVPRILFNTPALDGAVHYIEVCKETELPTSDADPSVKVAGFVIKSEKDFRVLPKNKKNNEPIRVIGKRLIVPSEGYNKEVSLADLTSRLEGPKQEPTPVEDSDKDKKE